jgi:hypothetical protein
MKISMLALQVHQGKVPQYQSDNNTHFPIRATLKWLRTHISWNMRAGISRPFWVRNMLVGLSCLLYLVPSIAYFMLSYRINSYIHSPFAAFLGFMFACVALVSFLADYMHIPVMTLEEMADWYECPHTRHQKYPPSKWGRRDRIVSMIAALFAAIECGMRVGVMVSLMALGICFVLISYSRNSSSRRSWIIRHSMWHVVSSLVLFIIALS